MLSTAEPAGLMDALDGLCRAQVASHATRRACCISPRMVRALQRTRDRRLRGGVAPRPHVAHGPVARGRGATCRHAGAPLLHAGGAARCGDTLSVAWAAPPPRLIFRSCALLQVLEEFVLLGGGGWSTSGGGKAGAEGLEHGSLEHEFRQNPSMLKDFRMLFDSSADMSGASEHLDGGAASFTVRGVRFLVVRRTWNSFCMVSRFRRQGLVVCSLPAGMLLVCAFRRPVLAQQVVPAVEDVCGMLWQ